MADDNKVSFLLDLDISEFTEKGTNAKGIIEKLGESKNLSGLLEGLTSVGPLLASAGVAAFAFKEAIDLTLEGEEIKRVNEQFETLAKNAGIAPEKLKKGLEDAAKGLVDTDELIKIANSSIVKMGGSAEKLPEIMEIARKATQIYGGSAKSNFESISEAIANGNTRILKHYGIIVDSIKAEKDFAKANGTTADALSEAGKRQAVFNAALAAGNTAFKDVKENSESATTVLQTLKVTFSEIGQSFTLAFEKTIGPGVRSFLHSIQNLATQTKLHLQSSIGDGSEAAAAKLTLTQQKIAGIEQELVKLEKIKGTALDFSPGNTAAKLASLPKQLEKYKAVLIDLQSQNKSFSKENDESTDRSIASQAKATQASLIDKEKQKANEQLFIKELDKIDKAHYDEQKKNVSTFSQAGVLANKQAELNYRQHVSAVTAIKNNAHLTDDQKLKLEVAENKRYEEQKLHDEDDALKERMKLLDNYVENNKRSFSGIEAAFKANTEKMKVDQADFGKRGNEMWNSLSSNATAAFTNMGAEMAQGKDIASATADAMRGFFLGMLADRAMAEGSFMLLSSVWPPNPLGIAAGTGLLALGGALKSVAGASSSAPTTAASAPSSQATSSGAAAPQVPISSGAAEAQSTAVSNMQQQAMAQRSVSVNIAGNYLETDSTKRMLMDLMRQESDATGFNYNQIGA